MNETDSFKKRLGKNLSRIVKPAIILVSEQRCVSDKLLRAHAVLPSMTFFFFSISNLILMVSETYLELQVEV